MSASALPASLSAPATGLGAAPHPWLWVVLLLAAVALLALIVYLIWQARKAARPAPVKLNPGDAGAVPETGLILPTDLPESFSDAMHQMSAQVPANSEYRYALPWVLLLGPPDAGKSGLVRDSSLASSLQERVEIETGAGLAWNFLPSGVLIEVGGWAYGASAKANDAWKRLTGLLLNNRPARPLDGIVLAIPASELTGHMAMLPVDLVARGALIQKRLQELTSTVSFQLPLYILITKCDLVPGFTEFAGELGETEFDQIFGWSQPESKLAAFQSEWVDAAFESMRIALELKQAELFAQVPPGPGRDNMFLFPGELLKLAPALNVMLTRAMRSTDGVQASLLRGIYCCGSVRERPTGAGADAPLVPVSVPGNNALHGMVGKSARSFLNLSSEAAPDRSRRQLQPWLGSALQVAFVHDLLLKKVFAEQGVAVPLPQRLVSRDRLRTSLQIVSAVLAVTLGIGTAVSYHRLVADRESVLQLFSDIETDLSASHLYRASGDMRQRRTDAEALIQAIAGLKTKGLHSVFLPASYIDSVDEPIRQTMVPVFNALVLNPLRGGLVARIQRVGDQDLVGGVGSEGDACALRPVVPSQRASLPQDDAAVTEPPRRVEDLPEYRQMRGYLEQVETLEKNLNVYNQLSTSGVGMPVQSIVSLDAYLQCRPPTPISNRPANPYLSQVLKQAQEVPIDLAEATRPITAKAAALTTALYGAWIENNPVQQVTTTLARRIDLLGSGATLNARQLADTQLAFSIASSTYKNPSLAWTAAQEFQMPADLAGVTTEAFPASKLFEQSLPDRMDLVARADFDHLANAVDTAETTLTGTLVTITDGDMNLSDKAQDLQVALADLMALDFMANASAAPAAVTPAPSNFTWDKGALEAAAALPASYRRYLAEGLQNAPVDVRERLRAIAGTQLKRKLQQAIALAMVPAPPVSPQSQAADLSAQVQNFSSVQPTIEALLASLAQLNLGAPQQQLAKASVDEAAGLLGAFDTALYADAPYGVRSDRFALWTVGGKPTAEVFAAPTADAMAAYLATQRATVEAYTSAAQPLVAFLRLHRAALTPAKIQVLARWEGLLKAVDANQAKQPGNSIQSLEDFIATGANTISPSGGCVLPPAGRSGAQDYFTGVAVKLRAGLLLRCQVLATDSYESRYLRLAQAFNRDLAGLFPFAPATSSTVTEADPQLIARVFSERDAASDLFAARTNMPAANRLFLQQLEASRPWFASILNTATAAAPPTLDFAPTFRVNQANEIGGNQIIAWTLQVGGDTYRYGDPPAKGHWSVNQPITLSLRWAKNAAYVPAPAAGQAHPGYKLRVDGDTITYTFDDTWSLLRMVQALQPTGQNISYAETQDVFTLVLTVPEVAASAPEAKLQTTPTASARVYLRLQISTPAGAGEKQNLTNTVFPYLAPPSPGP